MSKISVVIPFYNREETILNAIQSVLVQDFGDIEVLAIDDGSFDSSSDIVNSITDSRVRLIKLSRNQGAQAARNVGIKAANSDWIAFLDSDDVYLPNSLRVRYQYAIDQNVKVLHSDCLFTKIKWKKPRLFRTPPLQGNIYFDLLHKPGPFFQALLVTKEALENIGYLDEDIKAFQEWDTSINLAKKYKFAFLSQPTFIYQIGSKNSISNNIYRNAHSYLQIVKKHENEIVYHCGRKTLADHYLFVSLIYYRGFYKPDALHYVNEALKIDKFNLKYNALSLIYYSGIKIPSR